MLGDISFKHIFQFFSFAFILNNLIWLMLIGPFNWSMKMCPVWLDIFPVFWIILLHCTHTQPYHRPAGVSSSRMIESLYFCGSNQRIPHSINRRNSLKMKFSCRWIFCYLFEWASEEWQETDLTNWCRCVCFNALWPSNEFETSEKYSGFFLITREFSDARRGW